MLLLSCGVVCVCGCCDFWLVCVVGMWSEVLFYGLYVLGNGVGCAPSSNAKCDVLCYL